MIVIAKKPFPLNRLSPSGEGYLSNFASGVSEDAAIMKEALPRETHVENRATGFEHHSGPFNLQKVQAELPRLGLDGKGLAFCHRRSIDQCDGKLINRNSGHAEKPAQLSLFGVTRAHIDGKEFVLLCHLAANKRITRNLRYRETGGWRNLFKFLGTGTHNRGQSHRQRKNQ